MTPEMVATAGEALIEIAAKLLSGVVTLAEANQQVADALGPLGAKLQADEDADTARHAVTDAKIDAIAAAVHAHVVTATAASKPVSWDDIKTVLAGAFGLTAPPAALTS